MKTPGSSEAPDSSSAAAPAPFVPAVVEPANPLQELNETKAKLTALETRYKKLTEERDGLSAQIGALEKNPLLMVMGNLDGGSVLDEAGEKLSSLCAVIRRRQAKGKFVFAVTVKPFKGDALVFVPQMKVTEPEEEVAQGIFYSHEDGSISRQDPRQRELPFSRGDRSSEADGDPYADERDERRSR